MRSSATPPTSRVSRWFLGFRHQVDGPLPCAFSPGDPAVLLLHRLRRRPPCRPVAVGKFVTVVLHPRVAAEAAAAAIAARLADELPPRRLLVASPDRPLWQRALGLEGFAPDTEALATWLPQDLADPAEPAPPPIAGPLAARGIEAEHVWSAFGWRWTLRLLAWRYPDTELVMAVGPHRCRVPVLGGRTEAVYVPAR